MNTEDIKSFMKVYSEARKTLSKIEDIPANQETLSFYRGQVAAIEKIALVNGKLQNQIVKTHKKLYGFSS